ncbi:MAG: class I SAM-dependent methyltransferase [bacterium]|nr:class I SAM-dependent methyltransferase [bacterium]
MGLSFDYDAISEIYDELMQFIPYREWAKYVNELSIKHSRRGSSLLDLGGGTGNVASPLCEMGFDVTLIDKSEKMLQEAQKKVLGRNISILCGDIRNLPLKEKFDVALCMYDTVNHIDEKDLMRFFFSAYDSLKDGGIFMFDFNTDFGLGAFASHTQYRDGNGFKSTWNTSYDEKRRICTLDLLVEFEKSKERMIFQERAIDIEELSFSLSNSGFREKHLYHFLTTNGLKRTSERGMAVCIK